jgi:soluble lytic murein transglycosylase
MKSILILLLLLSVSVSARPRLACISFDQDLQAPRWMYDSQIKIKGPPVIQRLVDLRKAELGGRSKVCMSQAGDLMSSAKGLKVWLAVTQLRCALKMASVETSSSLVLLSQYLELLEKNPQWLIRGPQVQMLVPLYVEGHITVLERPARSSRALAWQSYNTLLEQQARLTSEQMARIYRAAGELAFVEQNLTLATNLFSRSLSEKESAEVRRRLESLRPTLSSAKEVPVKTPTPILPATVAETPDQPVFIRMKKSIENGELLPALDDAIELVSKYSGSESARIATDRIVDIYLSLGARTDAKFPKLRAQAVEKMLDADASRLSRWATIAFNKGLYNDAMKFAEGSVDKFGGSVEAAKMALLAGISSVAVSDYGRAAKWFQKLITNSEGSEESKDAHFRLALVRLREGKWADAATLLERLQFVAKGSDWEYPALYWRWRAQQKLGDAAAGATATRLMEQFPLTYYGLRARAELNDGKIAVDLKQNQKLKVDLWFSDSQGQAWERLQLLLKAGWFEEAQAEITALPESDGAEEKIARARLLGVAFDHYQAIRIFNETWNTSPETFSWSLVPYAFPVEYRAAVEKEARNYRLDEGLIQAVMRQESTFRPKVVSPAGAIGVMQLMPATAVDLARSMKPSISLPEDLNNPEINIRLGSLYLSRLLKAYKGHLPLALAAYNAGVGRLRKWMQSRTDLNELSNQLKSSFEEEIWIDELPWEETSFYVKAVLRNLLIYRLLESSEIKLSDPVWGSLTKGK